MHQDKETELIRDILFVQQKTLSGGGKQSLPRDVSVHWNQAGKARTSSRAFYYINNPTGSVRWFFPKESSYPAHLALYNSAHWKAKLYKMGTFAAFALRAQKFLCSGQFLVDAKEDIPLERMLTSIPHETYGVFTGTAGENRKSIIALAQENRISHFAKLAHTAKGEALLANEARTLRSLGELKSDILDIPQIADFSLEQLLVLTNIRPESGRESALIEDRHLDGLEELYTDLKEDRRIGDLPMFQEANSVLQDLKEVPIADPGLDEAGVRRILAHLESLRDSLDPSLMIPVSLAHGDFTPWNMYVSNQAIHVYDWELARGHMPLLYDVFHFIYQSGILLLRQPFSEIQRQLRRASRLPAFLRLQQRFGLKINLMHRLYLLALVSYYMNIYIREPQVHMQVHWLMKTWDEALIDLLR